MAKSALKLNSTQKFIEILDVYDDVVILSGGNACVIVEVEATNFELLSQEEQNAKIYAYSSLLNSLSFPIQIVIRSKQLDISSYLETLTDEAKKTTNPNLARQIGLYRAFVSELIKTNTVLDKKFYIVIPYSSLEKGVLGAKTALDKNSLHAFSDQAHAALKSKAESVRTQLSRTGLKSEILEREKVVRLFYDIFNDTPMHPLALKETPETEKGKENK